jgi:exopolysaccharide biosynthesis polyprenyl glycosylphosphotransferase
MKRFAILFTDQRVATTFWVIVDIILINCAFALSYWVRYDLQLFRAVDPAFDVPYHVYWPFVVIFTLLLILIYRHQGIYRLRRHVSWVDEFYGIIQGTATGTVITIVFIFLYRPTFYSRLIFIYTGLITIFLVGLSRLIQVTLLRSMRRQGIGTRKVLIIGAGEIARTVMRVAVANPEYGFEIVGFLDDHPAKGETDIGRFKALGQTSNLINVITTLQIDEAIITLPWQYHRKIMNIMNLCERYYIRARIVPDLFQMRISHMHIDEFGGVPMISVREAGISGLGQVIKRGIDFSIAALALLITAPLMGLLALIIKMESPGPVLFTQQRVGKNGGLFTLYKFRSMVIDAEEKKQALQSLNEADGPLFKIKNDPRVTRLGRLMRRLSIDELPQLYNVLTGDMSLIGPRPPIPSEVEQYQVWHKRRLEVAPGITGLSQVSGRSELTFDETALLDIYYIENWSPLLDTKILLQTIPKVLFGRGAY